MNANNDKPATLTPAAIEIVHTDIRVANHATGESYPRHAVKASCSCPECKDPGPHHGTAYRGETRLTCGWCGHQWSV